MTHQYIEIKIKELEKRIEALEHTKWTPISEKLPDSDGCYRVIEKSGNVGTYVFHKEGNSEEYWKRCAIAWQPLSENHENKVIDENYQKGFTNGLRTAEYRYNNAIAEIEQIEINGHIKNVECFRAGVNVALNILNKYKAEGWFEE